MIRIVQREGAKESKVKNVGAIFWQVRRSVFSRHELGMKRVVANNLRESAKEGLMLKGLRDKGSKDMVRIAPAGSRIDWALGAALAKSR